MRIMLIGNNPFEKNISGTQVYLLELARELVKRNNVSVFCGTIEKQKNMVNDFAFENIGFRIIDCSKKFGQKCSLKEFLDAQKPDIVHVVSVQRFQENLLDYIVSSGKKNLVELLDYSFLCPKGTFFDYNGKICRCPGIKCVRCMEENLKGEKKPEWKKIARKILWVPRFMQRKKRNIELLNRCHLLKANSQHIKQVYENFGLKKELIAVHSKGIVKKSEIKKTKKKSNKKIVFGFIGTLFDIKGAHILIDAFNGLSQKAKLVVYGYGDRDYIASLKIKSLDKNIEFKGGYRFDELKKILENIDIVVVPSVWEEPFGVAAVNALSYGVPVIASNTGGLKEIVKNAENGFLFERENTSDLRQKMLLLTENPKILENLKKNISRQKSIEQFAEETEELYKKILSEKRDFG